MSSLENLESQLKNLIELKDNYLKKFEVNFQKLQKQISETMETEPLKTNQIMKSDCPKFSKNRKFRFVLQSDGNFVVYNSENIPTWNSNTCNKGYGDKYLVLQDDGNLVIYDANHMPTWASNTCNKGNGNYMLTLQDSGNLVLTSSDSTLWQSLPFNEIGNILKSLFK